MKKENVGILGLVLNALGALILALSITESNSGYVTRGAGIPYGSAIVNEFIFKLGLLLLILGFSFQFLEKRYGDKDRIEGDYLMWAFVITTMIYLLAVVVLVPLFFP